MRVGSVASLCIGLAGLAPAPALAAQRCQLSRYLDLPVQMAGRRPLVTTEIDGKEARFIVDSGAFYSTMSPASAAEYKLRLEPAPPGFRLSGINGETSMSIGVARKFGLGGQTLPNIQFIVGGTDTGSVGLLGQNFLGIDDVEYDLPHGMIRLLHAKDCQTGDLAYWAGVRPVTVVSLVPRDAHQVHTIGMIVLNGVKLRAAFDTGAESSILTMAAARKAGIRPDSPGVEASGFSTGFGTHARKTWRATFDKIEIGGEAIPRPTLRFGEIDLNDADMLIGIDFFLTHRMYVSNKQSKMLVTYEGGPVFGLNPKRAVDQTGKALDLTDTSGEPKDAEGYARRGGVFASNGKLELAIADFDEAVALAPNEARYLRIRASARLARRQPLLASADLDKAVALAPDDAETRLVRAAMRLGARDPDGAREDLAVADKVLAPSSDLRLRLAGLLTEADREALAITSLDQWLSSHREDAARPTALNLRCWARGRLDRELDRALDDCNAAVRARPENAAYLDSRALVRLRRNELPQALADYDAALKLNPRDSWSLYARGLVKRKMGDTAGADADRSAALALAPGVAARAHHLGLEG